MRATITGNLVRDPDLKFTNGGKAVCQVSLADNYKPNKDADEEVTYMEVTLWGTLAENVAASMSKGQRMIAEGRVKQENWETDDGAKRSRLKIIADSAGPDLRFHVATVNRAENHAAPTTRGRGARPEYDDEPF